MNTLTTTTDFCSSYGITKGRDTNVISTISAGSYLQGQFGAVKRRSRTSIIYSGKIINTASESIEINIENSKKVYINLFGENQSTHLEVLGLFNIVKTLFAHNKSDKAVVYIFDIIDDWYIDDNLKFNDLFDVFYGKEFDEDIYVALLASTINLKNNQFRKRYFEYVREKLSSLYSDQVVRTILLGL